MFVFIEQIFTEKWLFVSKILQAPLLLLLIKTKGNECKALNLFTRYAEDELGESSCVFTASEDEEEEEAPPIEERLFLCPLPPTLLFLLHKPLSLGNSH